MKMINKIIFIIVTLSLCNNLHAGTASFIGSINSGGGGGSIDPDSITNTEINSSAAIDATKIHDGSISNTEFGYLNGVTSEIQTQFSSFGHMTHSVYAAQTSFDTYMMATYSNGTNGVGATLTSGMAEQFAIDGENPSAGSRVLLWDMSTPAQNGIYKVTDAGGLMTNWVLTRAADYDKTTEITSYDVVPVERGNVYAGTLWAQSNTISTIGTDAFVFDSLSPSAPFVRTANNLNDLTNPDLALANLGGGSPTGTGVIVRATGPTLVTPVLGEAIGTSLAVIGDITSSDSGDIGWSVVDQTDNQACTTGCTNACVFGIENATGTAVTNIVSCAATTADLCLCAGAN